MESNINKQTEEAINNNLDSYHDWCKELTDAKIDSKDDLNVFIKKCQDFATTVDDVSKVKMVFEAIHNRFDTIINQYADKMDLLFNDFIEHGIFNNVNKLRDKADEIYNTAHIALQIIDLLPTELTTNADYIQTNDNSVLVWALFTIKAQKLVSDHLAKTNIYEKDKFVKLYAPNDQHNVDDIYSEIDGRINELIEATCDNHIAHGKFKLSKLIENVFNHHPITTIHRKEDTRQTSVDLLSRSSLFLFIPAFIMPFIGFALYGKLAMVFCVLLVGVVQGLFIWPQIGKKVKSIIPVSKMDSYVKSQKRADITIRILSVLLGLLNIFPFLAQNTAFMQAIHGNSAKVYEGGTFVTLLTLIIIGIWFFNAYAMPKPGIIENQKLLDKENITMEEKNELEKRVREHLAKDADKLAKKTHEELKERQKKEEEEKYGEGCKLLLYNHFAINERTQKIYLNEKEYSFRDILAFEVHDNAVTIHSASTSTSVANTKPNTSSMLGRAFVGGVLLGNAGAVIGAATAPKTTEVTTEHSTSQSSVVHDYSITITVNNINSPMETINVGKAESMMNKIVSTLTVILNNNNKHV